MVFERPNQIVLYGKNKQLVFTEDDEIYEKIFNLNNHRASLTTYYDRLEPLIKDPTLIEDDAIYLEYHYNLSRTLSVPLSLENYELSVLRISFVVVGSDNATFTAIGKEESFSFTTLRTNIELSKLLLIEN